MSDPAVGQAFLQGENEVQGENEAGLDVLRRRGVEFDRSVA